MTLSAAADELLLAQLGLQMNANGGRYEQGKRYSPEKKLQVSDAFFEYVATNGAAPSQRALAKDAKVSCDYAKKVIEEINKHGRILSHEEIQEKRIQGPTGRCWTLHFATRRRTAPSQTPREGPEHALGTLPELTFLPLWDNFLTIDYKQVVAYTIPAQSVSQEDLFGTG
jgi:hypothetical protein